MLAFPVLQEAVASPWGGGFVQSFILIVGFLTCAFALTTIIVVALRVILDCLRLGIESFLDKHHNSGHKGAASRNDLKYRQVLLSGLGCLHNFVRGVWVGFYNCLTFVDGIGYPRTYEHKHKGVEQSCNLSHEHDSTINRKDGER